MVVGRRILKTKKKEQIGTSLWGQAGTSTTLVSANEEEVADIYIY